MQNYIEAIPTEYKGIKFRSKLEANYAKLFDYFDMNWMYEVEGYQFQDGTWYLSDFYFPDQDLFVEVKGIMSELDEHKIDLLNQVKPVIVGFPDGSLKWYRYKATRSTYDFKGSSTYDFEASYTPVGISRCPCCKKFQFRMPPTKYFEYSFLRPITDENPNGCSVSVDTTKCLICGRTSLGKDELPEYNINEIEYLFKYSQTFVSDKPLYIKGV